MAKLMVLISGSKFNRLTVVEFSHYDKRNRKHYLCKCDCGNMKAIQGSLLVSGNTKSCGCYGVESRKNKRIPDNYSVINHIILQYKRHAKDRGFSWDLSHEEVRELIQKPCHYCGTEKSNNKITKNCKEGYLYNGIDRIDSEIGYKINNIVPCCKICNSAKSNMKQKDFIIWIHKAANYTKAMATQWSNI